MGLFLFCLGTRSMRESLRVTDDTKKIMYYIYVNTPVVFRGTSPDIRLRFLVLVQPGVCLYGAVVYASL